MSVQRIGNFMINVHWDENIEKNEQPWNLVVLKKFTPTGTYVGKKTFYFSPYALVMRGFYKDELDSLWELPDGSKVKGGKWIWQVC